MTDSSPAPIDDSQKPVVKSWNQTLEDWFKSSGLKVSDVERAGLSSGTFYDYRTGRIADLSKVSRDNKRKLYSLTNLECFKVDDVSAGEGESPAVYGSPRRYREPVEKVVDDSFENLGSVVRELRRAAKLLESVVENSCIPLKHELNTPTPEDRADGVMQLIDVLAEEIDHYRTAASEERQVLVDKLKADPSSFGYVTQILNAVYNGKDIDSWMMMAQPPSKIRRAMRGGK